MRMNKKGSLQLSINAIVILILAVTMLGLGLGFVKKTFGTAESQIDVVSGQVKTDMIERLKESGKAAVLSNSDIELKAGDKETIYLAINNNYDQGDIVFDIGGPNMGSGIPDCDYVNDPTSGCNDEPTVTTVSTKNVPDGEVSVIPIAIRTEAKTIAGTYVFTYSVDDGASITNLVDFYVTVN